MKTDGTHHGFSKARLETLDRFLDHTYVRPGKMPCCQVQIVRRGELVHRTNLGLMDRERGRKLEADTIFRIYSMTKPVTSVAVMMLVEEGLIALDDPVHRYIPEWKDLKVYQGGFMETFQGRPPARPMLIVDLMRHTSGLTYGFQQRTNVDAAYRKLKLGEIEKFGSLDYMIEKLAGIPLEFSPGEAWNYSVSTDVLGYIVAKVSGTPFEEFLSKRIFKPLGMNDTGFFVLDSKRRRLAANYAAVAGETLLYDDPEKSTFSEPPSFISGGGGLVSTLADYERFCRMLINRGTLEGKHYLAPKTIALMTANHLPGNRKLIDMSRSLFSEAAFDGLGFGLGFGVTIDPSATLIPVSLGEYSWGGAASTFFWIDPKEDLFVIFMTQLLPSSTYPVRRQLRTLVYAAMTESNIA